MPAFSLRTRIVLGTVLWTAGLFIVTGVVATMAMILHPHLPYLLHRTFEHATASAVVAATCMLAGLWQVTKGLSSLYELRATLSGVRDGHARRIAGTYPDEVQPLVDDLNALLDLRERAVSRAIAKAGDLAHGLKTPLAVLAQEADCAKAAGHHDLAARLTEQIERMRRQMDYHLAQARAAASGAAPGAHCAVREAADGLARTLSRLHQNRITIEVDVAADHAVRGQREDLDEMLGNLIDNACKWATSRVAVTSALDGSAVAIRVDDDGPGIRPAMREAVLQRGVRADEAASGSGFGLAIVGDIAELYGGSIALADSPIGGLRAILRLPIAAG